MKAETGGLLLIVFMALGAVVYTQSPSPGASPSIPHETQTGKGSEDKKSEGEDGDKKDKAACYRNLDELVGEFFGRNLKDAPLKATQLAASNRYSLETLIATLPDPVYSRVGWRYDLFLDAIQRALEANGYVSDRFSMPWQCATKDQRAEPKDPPRLQESEPGVMLFRHTSVGSRKLLALLLVGETPTSGIHKDAFFSALKSIGPAGEVRLVGPHSSGSAVSLKIAIDEWHKQNAGLRFRIISGSATSPANKAILEDEKGLIDFRATVIPDNIALDKFREYLCDLDPDAKVAILRESNTGYGEGIKRAQELKESSDDQCKRKSWLNLPFPMHISGMRSAYQRDPLLKERPALDVVNMNTPPRSTLELPLDEADTARDVAPSMTPPMTSVAVESVLANILSTIARENIRYVGLMATDTRDKLFLASQIRRYCPDVKLFTTEGDLFYSHPSQRPHMEGMIIVSTYPLFTRNQLWSHPFRGNEVRLQFPIHGAYGVYNATLALLNYDRDGNLSKQTFRITEKALENLKADGVPDEVIADLRFLGSEISEFTNEEEYRSALKDGIGGKVITREPAIINRTRMLPPPFVEYSPPLWKEAYQSIKPAVWLTTVGRNRPWPLKAYADYDDKNYVFSLKPQPVGSSASPPSARFALKVSWFATTLFVLFCLFCLANALGFWLVVDVRPKRELPAGLSLLEIFRLDKCLGGRSRKIAAEERYRKSAWWIFVCLATMLIIFALPGALALVPPSVDMSEGKSDWLGWLKIVSVAAFFSILLLTTSVAFGKAIRPGWKLFRLRRKKGKVIRPRARMKRAAWYRVLAWRWSLSIDLLSAASLIASALLCYLLIDYVGDYPRQAVLFYDRATSLASGVTPVVPAVLIGAGLYLWSLFELKRLRLLDTGTVALPFSRGREFGREFTCAGISEFEEHVKGALESPFLGLRKSFLGAGLLLALAFPCFIIGRRFIPTFEGGWFTWPFLSVFLLLYFYLALSFLRFISLWFHFRALLRRLESHPLVEAYDRLPLKFSKIIANHFWARLPKVEELGMSVRQLLLLDEHAGKLKTSKGSHPENGLLDKRGKAMRLRPEEGVSEIPELACFREKVEQHFASELNKTMSSGARVTLSRSKTQEYILKAARTTAGTLPFFWKKLSFERSNGNGASSKDGNPEKQPTIKLSTLPFADNVQFWVKLAEDFVAIQMVTFFSKAFVHMRNLLTFVTVCAFLLLMAVTSYPFQPHRLLTIFLWIVILSVVLASLIVFVQAERNEVLSRISKTTPNQISLDRWFVTGIITYGVLPIVGLLATQVPEMQSLFSWVEPLLRAFK
jgi:hypothetical protein